jgi:hypothetical protein
MRDGTWSGPSGSGVPEPEPAAITLETSSAMTETPVMTPTAFLGEISTAPSRLPTPTNGRVYAARRVRAPGWNNAALDVERIMHAVEGETK